MRSQDAFLVAGAVASGATDILGGCSDFKLLPSVTGNSTLSAFCQSELPQGRGGVLQHSTVDLNLCVEMNFQNESLDWAI